MWLRHHVTRVTVDQGFFYYQCHECRGRQVTTSDPQKGHPARKLNIRTLNRRSRLP